MSHNIYAVLKDDHRKFKALLSDIENTTERAAKTREALFAELKQSVEAHAKAEEATFYSALGQADPPKDMLPEAYAEHETVATLLTELAGMDCTTEEWTGKFLVLKENLTHHIKEEEETVFNAAHGMLSREEADTLGEKMTTQEAELKAAK
ncbi:MAG: hemerythrin domain-containing protein [bacterium]